MSNYEVQDLRFCFNTAEIGGVSKLRGYELSGVNSMLFKWTELEARKNQLIMRGDVLTGVELSGDDSIETQCVTHPVCSGPRLGSSVGGARRGRCTCSASGRIPSAAGVR